MLHTPGSLPHRRLRPESQRRQYEEFVEQKIEEYKDHLSRPELLGIADDAVRELELSTADQLVLTEVLMLDHVDRLIRKRLRLPTFRRWRERHRRLRQAQQEPTHWGIDVDSPLRELALCMEDGDSALVVGTGIAPCGYLLAAYESHVVLIDQDLAAAFEIMHSRQVIITQHSVRPATHPDRQLEFSPETDHTTSGRS